MGLRPGNPRFFSHDSEYTLGWVQHDFEFLEVFERLFQDKDQSVPLLGLDHQVVNVYFDVLFDMGAEGFLDCSLISAFYIL